MDINKIKLTDHALVRCQQRGIPLAILPIIVLYGKKVKTHDDYKSFINNKLMNSLSKKYPDIVSKFDKQIQSTAVIWNNDHVVTAFKIKQRLNWNN